MGLGKWLLLFALLSGCSTTTVEMKPFVAYCALKDGGHTDDGVPIFAMYCEPKVVK